MKHPLHRLISVVLLLALASSLFPASAAQASVKIGDQLFPRFLMQWHRHKRVMSSNCFPTVPSVKRSFFRLASRLTAIIIS